MVSHDRPIVSLTIQLGFVLGSSEGFDLLHISTYRMATKC